jgi:hypothetical protein
MDGIGDGADMTAERKPICFVSMPFGNRASHHDGTVYDFDAIYDEGIRPAIQEAGAESVRGDIDTGFIIKPVFERLLSAEILIADLTTANANVFYELGIRHAARKGLTIPIVASSERVPFDLALLRTLTYECENGRLTPDSARKFRPELTEAIKYNLSNVDHIDSPLFLLFDDFPGIQLDSPEAGAEIFLSYAREDEERVLEVYSELENRGFRPWMDQKDLKAGEKWELAIDTALRRADFILVFISQAAVKKRGYLRREIRGALDQSHEMLDTDIFLVPVRLDECEIPRELRDFQWVDLFHAESVGPLVDGLRAGLARR